MADASPGDAKATERLHQYWVHGEGAAKIGWGQGGDWQRCVDHLGKYIADAKGYCNLAHKAATGMYPAQHAAMEHGRTAMTATKAPADQGRAESLAAYVRSFPLEDISVRTTRDGRIVDAYLAVFDTPAEIHDQDGHYNEELDPVVFNRAISDARPQGSRTNWRVGVFYNHGMTIMGTPSDRHSMPVAVPMDIKTDGHGVRATDKYHRSQFCDEIVEGLESGAIPGYSFSGRFLRSNPLIPRGGFRRPDRSGNLPTVRRMESTLREYGPTPFPAYADAAVLGIRSDSMIAAMMKDPDLAMRMLATFRDGAPMDSPPLSGAPQDGDSPAEDSHLLVRSGRSVREEMQAERSAFLQRQYRRNNDRSTRPGPR